MNYAATATKVAASIRKNGKAATIVRLGSADGWTKKFNQLTGVWYWEDAEGTIVYVDPATDTEIACFVLEEDTTLKGFGIVHIDGTLVQSGDRLFLCTAQPVLGDTLEVGSDSLTVVRVVLLRPGDTTIYSEVQAR